MSGNSEKNLDVEKIKLEMKLGIPRKRMTSRDFESFCFFLEFLDFFVSHCTRKGLYNGMIRFFHKWMISLRYCVQNYWKKQQQLSLLKLYTEFLRNY
eukprot:UN24908